MLFTHAFWPDRILFKLVLKFYLNLILEIDV